MDCELLHSLGNSLQPTKYRNNILIITFLHISYLVTPTTEEVRSVAHAVLILKYFM